MQNPFFNPIKSNFILATDGYKLTHWKQYPKGTQRVYSYLESRGGLFQNTVFFGLQYYLKQYLTGPVVTMDMINEAESFAKDYFGTDQYFNREGWEYVVREYEGRLPLELKAVPEGMKVPIHNVLVTAENTDDKLGFLTNACETLLMKSWYPITVCTLSHEIKQLIRKYAKQTDEDVSPFHLNDFGDRGVSSPESAWIGGAAHLVNFKGTDTCEAVQMLKYLYSGVDIAGSVMASEHSTTTIYGKDKEEDAYSAFLDAADPRLPLSVVVDSWDTINAVSYILGEKLKAKILARPGKTVIRPDSGVPEEMVVQVLNILWAKFGGTINSKGFKVLNPHVGVIYGDGINYQSIDRILQAVIRAGFAISNVIFGMGGALLQQVNRDTQEFAFKCSWALVEGVARNVFKRPAQDPRKNSKQGRLKLCETNYATITTVMQNYTDPMIVKSGDKLQAVFRNGELLKEFSLKEIRDLADSSL